MGGWKNESSNVGAMTKWRSVWYWKEKPRKGVKKSSIDLHLVSYHLGALYFVGIVIWECMCIFTEVQSEQDGE